MCYKAEVQKRNEEKLEKIFDEYNVPKFIKGSYSDIGSRATRLNYWCTIKDTLLWLMEKGYINKRRISAITSEDIASIRKHIMII